MRQWLALLLIWPLTVVAGGAATDWTLERLMQSLSAVRAVDAHFTEQKQLAVLQEPLRMSGVLQYRAPAYVKKHTLEPHEESFEVDEDWLVIENPVEGKRLFSLSGYPQIRAFVESFRATLAGDSQSLKRYYRVQLQGQADAWTLRLEPTDEQMATAISAIVIRGQQARILSIETLEADGDRSLMTIEPTYELSR